MRCPVCGCTLISIHALLAESDKIPYATSELILEFLSTLSLRRATALQPSKLQGDQYFYPRSPCGERQSVHVNGCKKEQISIHALLAESDAATPSDFCSRGISIHALLAESDTALADSLILRGYFYPRSPCGERRPYLQWCHHSISISIHALLAESDLWPISCFKSPCDFYSRSPCGERPAPGV